MSLSQTSAEPEHSDSLEPVAPRTITARRVNYGLAIVVAILLTGLLCQRAREFRFLVTHDVRIDGMTLRLDPRDEMVTPYILRHGSYEPGETAVIRGHLHPGDTFIDVGANIGWYTVIASKAVGPNGRVIAFEPAPGSYALLSENSRRNGCRNADLVAKALSDKPGTLVLNLGETNKGHNSILKTPDTQDSVKVEAITLDDYLRDFRGTIDFIKIDVEGAEGFVLGGMTETLRKNPGMKLVMEFYPTLIRQAGFDPTALLRKFSDAGYEIFRIPVEEGPVVAVPAIEIPTLTSLLEGRGEYTNLLIKPRP